MGLALLSQRSFRKCVKRMKKYYLKLLCFLLPVSLLAQNTVQDTIMIGLSIPEIIFAEDKEESERLLSQIE